MFEPMELTNDAVIKVIGVGGGGGNAVEHMVRERIEGVEFFAVNTDARALRKTAVGQTIQIGSGITKGLGAGANPEVGRNSAEEDREALRAALDGADMVFIAAGMGGGTGTGAAPVVAEVAKDLGILTVAVVTKPFNFEGKKRMAFAEQGIAELSKHVDSLITIPNDKLLKVLGRGISLLDAFGAANDVLKGAVQGIAELITRPGLMNVDFADVRTVMSEMGYAMMGSGVACGEDRAEEAAEMAISAHCWKTSTCPARAACWSTSPPASTCVWMSSKPWVTPSVRSRPTTPPWLSVPRWIGNERRTARNRGCNRYRYGQTS